MTIMAAEAGSAAAEAGAAEASSGAGRAFRSRSGTPPPAGGASAGRYPSRRAAQPVTRRGGRTQQGGQGRGRPAARTGGRTQQGSGKVFPISQVRAPGQTSGRNSSSRRPPASPSLGTTYRKATSGINVGGPSVTNYEMVILAEYVLAVLLTAATPFARPNSPGLSPYYGRDMIQLAALTVFYFILALVAGASSSAARLSAWFGGLVLLTVGLGEAAALAKLLDVFGGGTSAAAGTQGGSSSGSSSTTTGAAGQLAGTLAGLIPSLTAAAESVAANTPAPNTTTGSRVGLSSQEQP